MSTLLSVALWVAIAAVAIGALAVVIIWRTRSQPLFVHVLVASVSGSAVMVIASFIAVEFMVLSAEDLMTVISAVLVGSVASAGIAVALGVRVRRASRQLEAMTRAIGAGELPSAPQASTNREFHHVGVALTEAASQLDESRKRELQAERARVEAISWISHDLRTPLAAIRAMAESIEDGVASDPNAYLRQISQQAETLAKLVTDLVEYSSVVSTSHRPEDRDIDCAALMRSLVETTAPIAQRRRIVLRTELQPVRVRGDARLLARAIQNLVENAVRYSAEGASIEISLRAHADGMAVVSVEDACGDLEENDLLRVFEPGWRGDATRMTSPGTGLGLAIARGIARAHEGEISVEMRPGGCRFTLRMPCASVGARPAFSV